MELHILRKIVKVKMGNEWRFGKLAERSDTLAPLPQYFAIFQDGYVRDLRNDLYSVVQIEDLDEATLAWITPSEEE